MWVRLLKRPPSPRPLPWDTMPSVGTRIESREQADAETTARILVVEDDAAIAGLYEAVLADAGYEVSLAQSVGSARSALGAPAVVYDAALLDHRLPDGTAMDLIGTLLEREPLCKSLVVTGGGSEQIAVRTAGAGAAGFLRKPVQPEELTQATARTVAETRRWRAIVGQSGETGVGAHPVAFDIDGALARLREIGHLTPSQTMTAAYLLLGYTDKEVADRLGCAERTAKHHVSQVLARTRASGRAGLLRVLLEDAGTRDFEPADIRKNGRR